MYEIGEGSTIEQMRNQLIVGSWVKLENDSLACVIQSDRNFITVAAVPESGSQVPIMVRMMNDKLGSQFKPCAGAMNRIMEITQLFDKWRFDEECRLFSARCVPV